MGRDGKEWNKMGWDGRSEMLSKTGGDKTGRDKIQFQGKRRIDKGSKREDKKSNNGTRKDGENSVGNAGWVMRKKGGDRTRQGRIGTGIKLPTAREVCRRSRRGEEGGEGGAN
jgi:hypothetical protein